MAGLFAFEGDGVVALSLEAKQAWVAFHDRTAEETIHLSGDLAAAWSKFRDTALRIALILHLVENEGDAVSAATMARAVTMAEWFKYETKRVYTILSGVSAGQRNRSDEESLLAWINERGSVTARDVARGPRRFRGSGKAEPILERLVKRGDIRSERRSPGPNGGPPITVYRPADNPNTSATGALPATQARQTRTKQGSVAVANA